MVFRKSWNSRILDHFLNLSFFFSPSYDFNRCDNILWEYDKLRVHVCDSMFRHTWYSEILTGKKRSFLRIAMKILNRMHIMMMTTVSFCLHWTWDEQKSAGDREWVKNSNFIISLFSIQAASYPVYVRKRNSTKGFYNDESNSYRL